VLLRPLGHATGENYTGGSVRHRPSRRAPNSGTAVGSPDRSTGRSGPLAQPDQVVDQPQHLVNITTRRGKIHPPDVASRSSPACRPTRPGAASAISETAYELAVVLGTAILGGIPTATYSTRVVVPAGLSPAQAASATETLGGATAVADLLASARHASRAAWGSPR
jgi:hypothetical protein